MDPLASYEIAPWVLLSLILMTVVVGFLTVRLLKPQRMKMMIIMMLFGVFCYSGYGIAFLEVDNRYIIKYFIFISCLCLPLIFKRKSFLEIQKDSGFDGFLNKHRRFVKSLAFTYLLLEFVPLVYPEVKLFNIFHGSGMSLENLWQDRWSYQENTLIRIIDAFAAFLLPFFLIYITQLQVAKENGKKSVCLFILFVLFKYMRYSYLGRYQMVIFAFIIFLLIFCVKGYKFVFTRKHFVILAAGALSIVPFLYAFTFIRMGMSADFGVSFFDLFGLLINSEAYYPVYYDIACYSPDLQSQTPITFFLWLLFLPIPSFIFPGKPTLEGDAFTYAVTGMSFGDNNFSSCLPSVLGESFMFFGHHFYWIEALVIGFVITISMKFLLRNRTMTFFSVYMIVYVLTLGRAGAASYMSTIINTILSVFLLYISYKCLPKKHKKPNNHNHEKNSVFISVR